MSHCNVDFLNFCQLMIAVGQFRIRRWFKTGSRVEVEGNELSLTVFSNVDKMDIDYMLHGREEYVFSTRDDAPSDYRSSIFRYVTDGIHPGFVQLLKNDGSEVTYSLNVDVPSENERNGPAITNNVRLSKRKKYNLTEEQASLYINKTDYTFANHSPYWPCEVGDWITRQQPQGSLSHDVIRLVVGYGCDFVCVSHKGYIKRDKEHEWRFSFSRAELILIKNWSRQQRVVYRTIRVLHKRSLDTGRESRLCTYHYKTLMLWAVETKSQCFWDDIMLFDSIRAVLMDMIHCLKMKCLLHYFIPTNNLFDYLLSEDLSDDVNVLLSISEDIDLIYRVLEFCVDEECCMSNLRSFVTVPQLMYTSLKISASLNNVYDNFTDLFCLLKQDSIKKSFSDVLGIAYGLIRESCLQQNDGSPYPMTEDYLGFNLFCENKSKNYSSDENLNHIFKSSRLFDDSLNNYYSQIGSVEYESWIQYCQSGDVVMKTTKMSAASKQMKYQLYYRCAVWMLAYSSLMTSVNMEHQKSDTRYEIYDKCFETLTITNYFASPVNTRFQNFAKYYAYWPERTPTVPISWFINKAYTANHYYTLLSDYKTSADICDQIINAYNVSLGNKFFAEQGLPVLLSTQWIEMYDRELQQVLGLAALCRFVIHGLDIRSVHLPVCPVQFAFYLKARCVLDTEEVTNVNIDRIVDEYVQHRNVICGAENYFSSFGTGALTKSLYIKVRCVIDTE